MVASERGENPVEHDLAMPKQRKQACHKAFHTVGCEGRPARGICPEDTAALRIERRPILTSTNVKPAKIISRNQKLALWQSGAPALLFSNALTHSSICSSPLGSNMCSASTLQNQQEAKQTANAFEAKKGPLPSGHKLPEKRHLFLWVPRDCERRS